MFFVGNPEKETKLSRGTLLRAARLGLHIADPSQFDTAADIDVIVLNKNGTLTSPIRKVEKVRLAYGSDLMHENEVLALAAGLESHSKHPIAKAIGTAAKRAKLELPELTDFRAIPGQGVTGNLNSEAIIVGGPVLLTSRNIPIYVDDLVRSDAANQLGNTVVYVVRNSTLLGMIELSESIEPEAATWVNNFHAKKIRVAMMTGDATGVAQHVADELKIAEVFAEILPSKTFEVIKKLKADGSKVAMVGHLDVDGIALAESNVGIAVGSKGKAGSLTAGLHLEVGGLKNIYDSIMLARRAKSIVKQGYAAIAAGLLVAVGILIVVLSVK